MASRTSSSSSSATPARRATAAATSRTVRTYAGSGEKASWTVDIADEEGSRRRSSRRRAACAAAGGGVLDRAVDVEHRVQAGDPEDLQQPLVRAHQAERAVAGPQPPVRADQHAEPGGVEELHPAQVDHDVLRPPSTSSTSRSRSRGAV